MTFAHKSKADFEAALLQAWKNKPEPLLRHVERMIDEVLNRFDPNLNSCQPSQQLNMIAANES